MNRVIPLYSYCQNENSFRGTNNLYIDTQVINYMRKNSFARADELGRLLTRFPPPYKLYYSAAHLGDFLKDTSNHKDDDLRFMYVIGMFNYLVYNVPHRRCLVESRAPIEAFYEARATEEQTSQDYAVNRKPQLDRSVLHSYDWFKETLLEYEKDKAYLNTLDSRDANTFLAMFNKVKLDSRSLTPELFVENHHKYFQEEVFTLSGKDASRFFLASSLAESDLMSYKTERFDLSQPNVADQIRDSEFMRNVRQYSNHAMHVKGLNLTDNYDELILFMDIYSSFQLLGVEPDKAKKFNVYSNREDAAHCYFASMCNYLITEDDGFYRRAKILYGLLDITTKVFRIGEFLDYASRK